MTFTKSNPISRIFIATFCFFTVSLNICFAYGATFDGGKLQGMEEVCSCSGGTTIKVDSYVDNTRHIYLYQMGATQLYANYNIMGTGNYFLTTLTPFATCMVYRGEDCENSNQSPEGTFQMIGTSFKDDLKSVLALFNDQSTPLSVSENVAKMTSGISLLFSLNDHSYFSLKSR